MRTSAINDNRYGIMNGPEEMWPNTEAVWFGAFSGESISNIIWIVNIFGFNQSLLGYSDDVLGVHNYFTAYPQGVVMAYSGVSWQKSRVIGADGLGAYVNGSGVIRIWNDWLLSLKNYIFPLANGSEWQVLTSHSNGQLSWEDGGWSSNSFGVSSINGSTGDVFITTDDIQQGTQNQFVQTARITLSSNDLLNLHVNPIQFIAAPWSGKAIIIMDIVAKLNVWSTPYTINGYPNIAVYYNGQNPSDGYKTSYDFLTLMSDVTTRVWAWSIGWATVDIQNKSIDIWYEAGASVTNWDGTVDLYITYKTIDL